MKPVSVITMWAIGNGGRENILGDLKKIGYGVLVSLIDYNSKNFRNKTLLIEEKDSNFKIVENLKM